MNHPRRLLFNLSKRWKERARANPNFCKDRRLGHLFLLSSIFVGPVSFCRRCCCSCKLRRVLCAHTNFIRIVLDSKTSRDGSPWKLGNPCSQPWNLENYIKKNTIFWLSAKPIWMTHLEFSTSFSSPLLGKISAVLVWLCVWELFLVDCESVWVPAPPISVSMELLSYDGRLHHPVDEEKEGERETKRAYIIVCWLCCIRDVSPRNEGRMNS